MTFYINKEFIKYEAGNIFRIFLPYEELKLTNEETDDADISLVLNDEELVLSSKTFNYSETANLGCDKKQNEYIACKLIFNMFAKVLNYVPKWGMLTGIHPVKLLRNLDDDGKKRLQSEYFVSDEKMQLCNLISSIQEPYISDIAENDFSLYISIPFCPSRCNYCSFVSQSIEKTDKLIAPYVELLLKEIEYTAKIVKENNLILRSVYFGGGTPTTLNSEQLELVISCVKNNFDNAKCFEFTVEAGRPDTITKEKLIKLKELGVQRISINPQTLSDQVLKNIGRAHSADDFLEKYDIAKDIGFESVNTDLIAGLQGDDFDGFKNTLDKIIELSPSNVTVHSLALKRSAQIFREDTTKAYHSQKDMVGEMIDYSIEKLTNAGYKPYYLYRQSRMAGNAENTGWTKANHECAYNIYTMDESQTVIACGAGGVSKLKDPYSQRLERVFNFKYSYEYIQRFEEILKRKDEVTRLYGEFRKRLH